MRNKKFLMAMAATLLLVVSCSTTKKHATKMVPADITSITETAPTDVIENRIAKTSESEISSIIPAKENMPFEIDNAKAARIAGIKNTSLFSTGITLNNEADFEATKRLISSVGGKVSDEESGVMLLLLQDKESGDTVYAIAVVNGIFRGAMKMESRNGNLVNVTKVEAEDLCRQYGVESFISGKQQTIMETPPGSSPSAKNDQPKVTTIPSENVLPADTSKDDSNDNSFMNKVNKVLLDLWGQLINKRKIRIENTK